MRVAFTSWNPDSKCRSCNHSEPVAQMITIGTFLRGGWATRLIGTMPVQVPDVWSAHDEARLWAALAPVLDRVHPLDQIKLLHFCTLSCLETWSALHDPPTASVPRGTFLRPWRSR